MMDQRASDRYARALLGLARERGELELIDATLIQLCELIDQNPAITHVILNSTIQDNEKGVFLEKLLIGNESELLKGFLKLLIKKRRFQELPGIQEKFHKLVEKEKGLLEVTAISAAPLSENNQNLLVSTLAAKLKAEIRLLQEVDKALIGGVIIRFEGREIDASFKSKLSDLKQRLVAAS